MGCITDFARHETRDFAARPFDGVDALVLAQIMYERMPSAVADAETATTEAGANGEPAAEAPAADSADSAAYADTADASSAATATIDVAEPPTAQATATAAQDENRPHRLASAPDTTTGESITIPTLAQAEARYGSLRSRLRGFSFRHPLVSLRSLRTPPLPTLPFAQISAALAPKDFQLETGYAGLGDPQRTEEFFRVLAANPRYSSLGFGAYEELYDAMQQLQFAAITVDLGSNVTIDASGTAPATTNAERTLAVAFRGTDTSLVGWKEDFNMASQYPIPAQQAAANYLCRVARLWHGRIIIIGHSKGGNLAEYAALAAPEEVRDRIDRVYALDSPGFLPEMMGEHTVEYRTVKGLVEKIVPESSNVGMIFEQMKQINEYAAFTVVQSDVSSGIMQHFAFTWQIGDDGHFALAPEGLSTQARFFNRSLNEWVRSMTVEQRRRVIDSMYEILQASGVNSIVDLPKSMPGSLPAMLSTARNLPAEDRNQMISAFRQLTAAAWGNLGAPKDEK